MAEPRRTEQRRSPRLAESVADSLRARILAQEFGDGDYLPKQEDLVREYRVSLPSVREALRGVETVIVDEVHAVAGPKRGAHLALSLERLDALLDRPAQRVGLSATVRPAS